MSKQSIADKSAIIRNETQKYANTRGRVADALDDINATKADNVDLEAEVTTRAQGDQTNADAIAAEVTTRAQGDQTNADAIAAEVTTRAQGDQTNADAIAAEVTARAQGDQTNADAIAAEATARAQGDQTNADAIAAEVTARAQGDQTNADAIAAEATARAQGDNLKLDKPLAPNNTNAFVVMADGSTKPAGDLGKNFFNSDLSNTTARNHTMNAGVTIKTLGNPHTLSGLPNKNADIANFRKVRVQNASGLDSVVDSKNLLTDGVTSMTDAEKDAWRLAQRKTGENYSTGQPRIDFILPFKLSKNISGIQYFSCIGSNLLLNLSDCEVKLINTSTNAEYPISVVNTSVSTTSQFSIGYDISSLPVGSYKVYVRNGLNTNIDTTTFDVVDNILYFDMSAVTWQKNVLTSGDFTGSTAIGGNINRQSPDITGEPSSNVRKIEFLSSEILNALEANGNFIIEIDFSRYRANVHNPSYLGLVDSTVNSLNGSGQIMFGWASLSGGGNRTTLFPTSTNAGGGDNLGQESGKVVISKKGSIIQMMAILSGNIYITTNISQANSYTGLKLMYFDYGISGAYSGAQQTYSIKLYK